MFRIVTRELKKTEENGYRDVLREVFASKATNIILDCGKETIGEVLKQAQQVGMISQEYYYLLTSLDAHTVDLEDFKYSGTNFTMFRMIDTSRHEVRSVIENIVKGEMNQGRNVMDFGNGNLDTDTALIYDSVELFARALHELARIQVTRDAHLRLSGHTFMCRLLSEHRHRSDEVPRAEDVAPRQLPHQLHEAGRVHGPQRQGGLRHEGPEDPVLPGYHGAAGERPGTHR